MIMKKKGNVKQCSRGDIITLESNFHTHGNQDTHLLSLRCENMKILYSCECFFLKTCTKYRNIMFPSLQSQKSFTIS